MDGIVITKQHLRVPIIHTLECRWCRGIIWRRIVAERIKTSSHDVATETTSSDYHESCWNEAIEIQI